MSGKVDPYAACPYYKKNRELKIVCEGVVEGACLHNVFETNEQLKDYRKQFCRKCWKNCLIADMLNRKWEYDA